MPAKAGAESGQWRWMFDLDLENKNKLYSLYQITHLGDKLLKAVYTNAPIAYTLYHGEAIKDILPSFKV